MAYVETAAARQGDHDAFANAMNVYGRGLFRLMSAMTGSRETAEDIVQETFLRLWNARETLDDNYPLYPWLRRVAMNLAMNERDARSRRRSFMQAQAVAASRMNPNSAPAADAVENEIAGQELAEKVQEALKRVAPERRAVLLLRVIDELSYEQIAQALSIPIGTVMSSLHRARLELKEALA